MLLVEQPIRHVRRMVEPHCQIHQSREARSQWRRAARDHGRLEQRTARDEGSQAVGDYRVGWGKAVGAPPYSYWVGRRLGHVGCQPRRRLHVSPVDGLLAHPPATMFVGVVAVLLGEGRHGIRIRRIRWKWLVGSAFDGLTKLSDPFEQYQAELAGRDAPGWEGAAVMQRRDFEVHWMPGAAG